MSRRIERRVWFAFAALALGAGYGFWPREDRKILDLLEGLCEKLNQTHDAPSLAVLNEAVARATAPSFSVRVRELGDESRDVAGARAWTSVLLSLPPLTFSLVGAEVHLEGSLARVHADLLISERGSSEQHRDLRPTQIELRRVNGAWLIESIVIDAIAPERPEARP